MSRSDALIYSLNGNAVSDQAQPSNLNPKAGETQMRILIELQVLSMMFCDAFGVQDNLAKLRQDVADSL